MKASRVLLLLGVVSIHGAPTPHLVDLGFELNESTVYWPGTQRFNFTEEKAIKDENGISWFASNSFETSEHVGTHLDAPFHFNENGWKVAEIPLDRLIVPGILIDVSEESKMNNSFALQRQHIEAWEEENGVIPDGCVVLFRFGWSSNYENRTAYFGFETSKDSKLNFPGISKDAADYIVETGKVYGVGLDTPSIDPGENEAFDAHQILLGKNIYGLENLNLQINTLPATGFTLQIMPMKITKGTGAPCRVVAIIKPSGR